MRRSAEVRWFYRQQVPSEVRDWFCGSRLCREEPSRTDHYLILTGSSEVGVKVRDGRKFEIKARTRAPEPLTLLTGASVGRQDAWVKWSLEDCDAADKLAAIGSGSSEWCPVTKRRWLRKFHLDPAGQVEEIDSDAVVEHGCRVEVGEVTARDSQWWTLGFDSFGDTERAGLLEQVARHFLHVLPHGLVLTERSSMAFPEWLNRLVGQG